MIQPIMGAEMLRTAERLAETGVEPRSPCDVRRSISTSYYAVFHQLTRHGVYASVAAADEDDVALVTRWFTHQGLRSAANVARDAAGGQASRDPGPAATMLLGVAGAPIPEELVVVAQTFAELQDDRHVADYVNAYDPPPDIALARVELAGRALRAGSALWDARDAAEPERRAAHDVYRRFLLLALLSSGGPKSRR